MKYPEISFFITAAIGLEEAPVHDFFATQIKQYADRRDKLMSALDSIGLPYTVRLYSIVDCIALTYTSFGRFHKALTLFWQMLLL